jgi:hypothetical protein
MKKHAWWLALALTAVLAAAFLIPGRSNQAAATLYVRMEGKTLTLQENPTKTPSPTISIEAPIAPRPAPASPLKKSHKKKLSPRFAAPAIPTMPAAGVSVTPPAASATPPAVPAAASPASSYTLEAIVEKYESDPSIYSLDRTIKADDMTLTLLGLERRTEFFVLKLAVTNDSGSDFYVKDFVVQASGKTMVSKFFFRILVESQRNREGYVIFEKPRPGAAVQIQLKEETGKGRTLKAQIPYPF